MTARLALVFLLAFSFLTSHAYGQGATPPGSGTQPARTSSDQHVDPTDQSDNWKAGFPFNCSDIFDDWGLRAGDGIKPQCLHDNTQAAGPVHQQARSYSRWWKMGLLIASQIYLGVDWARDVWNSWKDIYGLIQSAFTGYDSHRNPSRTAYLLRRSLARFDRHVRRSQSLWDQIPNDPNARHQLIHHVALDALRVARAMEENATGTAEKLVTLQARLGPVEILNVELDSPDDWRTPEPAPRGLPPTPRDLPSNITPRHIDDLYDTILNVRQPQPLGFLHGGRTNGASSEGVACDIDPPDEEEHSPVLYYRVQTQAIGAQLTSAGVRAENEARLQQLKAIADAERLQELEMKRQAQNLALRRL